MARATGIEITDTEVRIAEIDGSDRKFRVLGGNCVPIQTDELGERSPELVGAAARQAIRSVRAKRDQVVLGLPARETMIREIVIPFTDPDQIRKVIKFESESHLSSANIDEVIVGFYKISETGPRSRVLIFAVEKAALARYLDLLGRVGIEPTQIDLAPTALFSLTRLIPELQVDEDDESTINVILDIGDVSTTFMLTQGTKLRVVRSMRLGADTLTRTLSQDLGIDQNEAREVTQSLLNAGAPFATTGDVDAAEPSTALTAIELKQDIIKDKEREFARRIVTEIQRTLSSIQVEGQVNGIWVTGTASTASGLEREFREAFGVSVNSLDVLGVAEHSLDPSASLFIGPSLGLGLKALEHDPVGLEFRQEEFAFARKFDRIRNPLLYGSALVLVLLAFLSILEWKKIRQVTKDSGHLAALGRAEFHNLIVKIPGDRVRYLKYRKPDEPEQLLRAAQSREPLAQIRGLVRELADIQRVMTEEYGVDFGGTIPPERITPRALQRLNSWLGVMNELRDKKKIGHFVDKLTVTDQKVTWDWRVSQDDIEPALAYLSDAFRALDNYEDYSSGSQRTKGDQVGLTNSTLNFTRTRN